MNTPSHPEWTERLSEYLNGDLGRADALAMEAHLAECVACRTVLAELEEIVRAAEALGPVQPERDLWPGIAAALAPAPGQARGADVIAFPGGERARRRVGLFFTVPQMAAAAVALVAISAAATAWAGAGVAGRGDVPPMAAEGASTARVADVAQPPEELAREMQGLEAVFAEARDRLDPNTVRILEKNLGVIQRAIDESVRALAVDPANAFLRDHLERAYREKADFLREVNTIAGWEG